MSDRTEAVAESPFASQNPGSSSPSAGATRGTFDEAFLRFRQPLLAYFARRTSDGGHAENLLQETFLKAFRYWHTYDPSRRFSGWLFGIAGNLYRDWLQDEPRHSGAAAIAAHRPDDPALPTPEETVLEHSAQQALRNALDTLPEKFRIVLVMKHYRQMRYRDIAQELGLNEGTVKSRMNTAASLLREKLRREGWL